MTLLFPPRATRLFALSCMIAICCTVGCQTSRLGKVPGMGWLSSRGEAPEDASSMGNYPAPSAAAIPTTITDSRNPPANSIATQNPASSSAYAAAANSPATPAGNAYPDTQYPSLPAAPAAVPTTQASPAAYANVQLPTNSSYSNTTSSDVQNGYYPQANSGTATTWSGPQSAATNASGSDSYAQRSASTPNTFAPQTASASMNSVNSNNLATNNYSNDRAASDFVAMNTSTTANAGAQPATASSVQNSSATSSRGDEFARYDSPTVNSTNVAPAAYLAAINETEPSTSPPMTTATAVTSNAAASHYASIAEQETRRAQSNGQPWQPGSTSRLQSIQAEAPAFPAANTQMATTPTATSVANQGGGGWE